MVLDGFDGFLAEGRNFKTFESDVGGKKFVSGSSCVSLWNGD